MPLAPTPSRGGVLASRRIRRAVPISYKWIGEQIGVTAQVVEGFIKYRQRRGGDTMTP